jgi:hypothetical protein
MAADVQLAECGETIRKGIHCLIDGVIKRHQEVVPDPTSCHSARSKISDYEVPMSPLLGSPAKTSRNSRDRLT